jgi:hypothetical protein
VWDEINISLGQRRYARNMRKTIDFTNYMIANNAITDKYQICATGFIIYLNYLDVIDMLNNIYFTCLKHEQPQCQIYWSIFSQKYSNSIAIIDFEEILGISHHIETAHHRFSSCSRPQHTSCSYETQTTSILFVYLFCLFVCFVCLFCLFCIVKGFSVEWVYDKDPVGYFH